MSEFQRENRYIVIKRKHLELLTDQAKETLENIIHAIAIARQPDMDTGMKGEIDCVVVERDWPEYEKVWAMIEARVNGIEAAPEHVSAEPITKYTELTTDEAFQHIRDRGLVENPKMSGLYKIVINPGWKPQPPEE